jgi:TspO/MBR family
VDNGRVVCSAGISAGIDMNLHVVGRLLGWLRTESQNSGIRPVGPPLMTASGGISYRHDASTEPRIRNPRTARAAQFAPMPLFMPIFSGLRNVPLAAVDIVIVWLTIIWCVLAVRPYHRWVAVAQGPYFVWVSTATVLQLSITAMNW